MGNFRVEINAVGGHGCSREVKNGGTVFGCRIIGCADCETREFVGRLKAKGVDVKSATLTHWPGDPTEVQDDLVSGVRTGSF